MILSLPNLRQMGVINLAPDSFSDGNKNLDSQNLKKKRDLWSVVPHSILDFGAESTAPMNQGISAEEELARFERYLLPLLKTSTFNDDAIISLDTYRPQTVSRLMPQLKKTFKGLIVWNDVSGLIDDETLELLEQYPELHYILCHNWAERRFDVQKHMEFCKPLDDQHFLKAMIDWFQIQLEKFPRDFRTRLWLDPCFGFAKTLEQNLFLFQTYENFFQAFPHFIHLIGISRKSFLRHSLFLDFPEARTLEREALNNKLDERQKNWLKNLCERVPSSSLIVRTHCPL